MHPSPIFTIFGRSVYLYGVLIAIGLMACLWVLYYYTKKKNMPSEIQDYIFIIAIIAVALGFLSAKLFQAFYDYLASGVWDFYGAGITAMGGFIGGAAAFIASYFGIGHFVFKNKKARLHIKEFNKIVLVAPLCITIAHAFGRLGCLMSGCCHGAYLGQESVFGGIYMYGTVNNFHKWGYYVPTQLYEALFLFALFAVLSVMYFKGSNVTMHVYLIAYGVWRIFVEFLRTDYRGGAQASMFSPSQWVSFIFIGAGIALFIIYKLLKIPYKVKEEK